jgi:Dehydrogenases with different specificities (related to short-chain alcohol dehydrogenases)
MDIKNIFNVAGKTAVITGGTGVLGSEMTRGLARAGAKTVIIGRNRTNGEKLQNELIAAGATALFVQADVLEREQLEKAKQIIIDKFGAIDILVNAAGGNMPGAVITPQQTFFDLDMDQFDKVVDLNLKGTVLPTLVFCDSMRERRSGVIVNIASMASFRAITRVVGYGAAKAAVMNFTEWLAIEMSSKFGEGIRVNGIAPGFFITEQNRSLLTNPDGSYTERGENVIRNTPFKRFGQPDELVGTLLYLCSDASRFVTGVTVPVDGGFNIFSGV